MFFWTDLSAAKMIEGSFTYSADDGVTATPKQIGHICPPAKIGQGYVILYGEGERETTDLPGSLQNNFQLVEFNLNISGVASGIVGIFGGPLTPIQAQGFDQKVDDGLPASGAVSLMLSRAPPSPIIMPPQAGRSVSPNISIQNILDEDGSLACAKPTIVR